MVSEKRKALLLGVGLDNDDGEVRVTRGKNFRLVGRRTRKVYRLGDAVRVGVMKVDKLRSELDLFLVDEPKQRAKKTPKKKSGRRKATGKRK